MRGSRDQVAKINSVKVLLGGDGRLWLVDWEFSSMADPAWDPASVLMQRKADEDERARGFVAAVLGDARGLSLRSQDGALARGRVTVA